MTSAKLQQHGLACTRKLWLVLQGAIVCTIALFFLGFALRALKAPGSRLLLYLGVVAAIVAIVLIFLHALLTLAAYTFGWVKRPLSVRVAHCIVISSVIVGLVYVFYRVAIEGLK
jgi:hypothetical protein